MTSQRPDPLTPEERELAGRLGRIAPRATPSAELDARILGAAHAAAGRRAGPARPRSRWPALVGIAATLALAVGVVWQLRPVHEVPVEREEMPSSAVIRSPATATVAEAEAPVSESDLSRPAKPRAADIAAPAQSSEPRLRMLPPPAPRPAPPVVFDDPSPVDAPEVAALPAPPAAPPSPVPAPPPPPAPPAPPAPVIDTAAAAVNRPAAAAQARYQADSRAAAMQRKATAATADRGGTDDAPAEPGDIDTPRRTITIADVPVDSDHLLDPVDWIERIRQRRDSGDLDSARASLDALREAHPALTLPDDVLAIATASETPPER
ncbi:hypothetical protein [Lysobacter sp. F60174L2]|uniref:hypothetical protein n=1 Tax=Lysobacter sp. F60174L2 TaxID=3459295 RepID=UPI00403D7C10